MGKVIRTGVTDFYVSVATQAPETGAITYAAPKTIGGTASVGVSMQSGENKVYESDIMIRNAKHLSGANISYKSRTVSMEDEMELLHGLTSSTSGEYEDGPDNLPKNVAVGWAAKRSDGSYACVWYYWCTGAKGDENYETATEQENSPEDEYTWAAMPSPDTRKLRRRKICANAEEMAAFFQAVLPVSA